MSIDSTFVMEFAGNVLFENIEARKIYQNVELMKKARDKVTHF